MMGNNRTALAPILLLWLVISGALIWVGWSNIVSLGGFDPDDKLRMVQLRDFLAGQSWFDTTQYRMNPPDGAPMHWSRLIELPLAFLIVILTPIFGSHVATMIAGSIVPLLLLLLISYMLAQIATRIASREAGVVAAMIALSSSSVLMQLRPMRIDHHGWQIAMAVLALLTMFWTNARRGGAILGVALAIWLHISLEGAPMTAAFFLVLGWRWMVGKDNGTRLFWAIAVFAGVTSLLFIGTQAQPLIAPVWCDTVSPPHVLAVLFAAAVMLPALRLLRPNPIIRGAVAAVAGGGALAIILAMAPQCTGGAFADLDPLVREYWYSKVNEGMPVWYQPWRSAIVLLAGPVCGAIAWVILARKSNRDDWPALATAGFFLFYALLLTVLVIRTVSVAAAYAIPITAALIAAVFFEYRRAKEPVKRVGLVAAMLALLIPGAIVASILSATKSPAEAKNERGETSNAQCQSVESVAALKTIRDARFVAPFDMGPTILLATPNKVLASSHHRNWRAMHDHIEIFRSPSETALPILKKHGITHIAICPSEAEMAYYAKKDPNGLWAQLKKGNTPAWLERLPDMGEGINVWRLR